MFVPMQCNKVILITLDLQLILITTGVILPTIFLLQVHVVKEEKICFSLGLIKKSELSIHFRKLRCQFKYKY